MPKLEPYSRKLDYSYQLGVFPALMLLEARPECAQRLLLDPRGLENEGVVKLRARCAELGVREEMAERILRRESKKDNCFAGLVFKKYDCPLDECANHVVLCQISDNGNAGTAMRPLAAVLSMSEGEFTDLRSAFSKPKVDAAPYYQVFASRHGFLPDLSIVDLLFNMGPEGLLVLKKG